MAGVYPELVAYDADGRPETIRYQLFDGLFLDQIQKQHRRQEAQENTIQTQNETIERLQAELGALRERLTEIEMLIEKRSR